jgi:hypothetical protein
MSSGSFGRATDANLPGLWSIMLSMNKYCPSCKATKDAEKEFHKNRTRADGYQRECKECKSKTNKRYYRAHSTQQRKRVGDRNRRVRDEYKSRIFAYLSTHPCVDCGESDPIVLEFDHRDEKKMEVMTLVRRVYAWHIIVAEIEKCEVRCANCHRRVTYKRMGAKRYYLTVSAQSSGDVVDP